MLHARDPALVFPAQWISSGREIGLSTQVVEEIIRRARGDEEFRQRIRHDPDGALHGYDISYAERAAIVSGDELRLRELGIDEELSHSVGDLSAEGPANV
jgi:hypothetical protein